jgi:hypothetical protein
LPTLKQWRSVIVSERSAFLKEELMKQTAKFHLAQSFTKEIREFEFE